MEDYKSAQTNEYYKNLNKHGNCSKCNVTLNQDTYKKGRTVCKLCYNNHVLTYYKNKFCSNSSLKTDVGTQTDFCDNQDSSRKQVSCRKQISSRKQYSCRKQVSARKQDSSTDQDGLKKEDSSKKQDILFNYITDVDPNLLCDKLGEISEKPVR